MNFSEYLFSCQARVDQILKSFLSLHVNVETNLSAAINYSLFSGGKRIRPVLVYATAKALNIPQDKVDAIAAAVELIHCYSLIHDDLPAMDDDDFRRGKPSCHKAFNEAAAILAGDAMQGLAFQLLTDQQYQPNSAEITIKMINHLADAIGINGMASGQAFDLFQPVDNLTLDDLERIHALKTGALFNACIVLVTMVSISITEKEYNKLVIYADLLGLAFQICDDLHDMVAGHDQKQGGVPGELSYPQKVGVKKAKQKIQMLFDRASNELSDFGDPADQLINIMQFIVEAN